MPARCSQISARGSHRLIELGLFILLLPPAIKSRSGSDGQLFTKHGKTLLMLSRDQAPVRWLRPLLAGQL